MFPASFILRWWPPPFTEQWATTYLQVLFESFLFALGVPTAIYSLIIDNDIKRVALTRVKYRRYFVATGLLYAAVFSIVWIIHPDPDPSPCCVPQQQSTLVRQPPPTAAAPPQTTQPPQQSLTSLASPTSAEETTAQLTEPSPAQQQQQQATPTPEAAQPAAAPPQLAAPDDAPTWMSIIKSTFAATTVTILPSGVLFMGLWLNGQFKREKVVKRLEDDLFRRFEADDSLDSVALKDLSYLGEQGKSGDEKELVLDVIDRLAKRVQNKVKEQNLQYDGFELEVLIRHIPGMLDNHVEPGNDQNYRRAVEVLSNIWRWLGRRRTITDDALSTREVLKHLALLTVEKTGEETALAYLEVAAECDSHVVLEFGLAAFKADKFLLAAAALNKLEEMAADAIAGNRDFETRRSTLANLLGMTAHFAISGPSGLRRAETSLRLNEELFAPTLRSILDDAIDYQYEMGRYDTSDALCLLVPAASKMKSIDLNRPIALASTQPEALLDSPPNSPQADET
ncbi:MAG TPA: hypothetical protein VGC89_00465 [Pyrinomonadaceae bacterium]